LQESAGKTLYNYAPISYTLHNYVLCRSVGP
jgi:hypothetical protein